jgi:hypothetical protein
MECKFLQIINLFSSRQKAKLIIDCDKTPNTSSLIDKSLKSTNASIIKEMKTNDRALNKSKEILNISRNEELNISNEMRVANTQPSKEIDYQLPEKNERLDENDISQIKKSFKNLEDHLMDF